MNNSKKVLTGLLALSLTAGFTACGGGTEDGGSDTAAPAVTTTTGVTVPINTDGLTEEEVSVIEDTASKLQDVELENKEVKWLAHYTINPGTNGQSKSVALELFERKYGGTVIDYNTSYENRYNDLSTYVLGGEGIDIFPGNDVYNFPKGIISGMFQPVDNYIDMDSAIWQNSKEAMELYNFGGKHFNFVTDVTAEAFVIYNKETIDANGLDDPWELYKAGEWNWDTFKSMLNEFVDQENDQWGLDGFWAERALMLSAGVPAVGAVDGQVVCNLNDPTLEKAMNYQYELYNAGLVFPREQFEWSQQPQMMGDGRQLFYICDTWTVDTDPETWVTQIEPENLGLAPVPSPAGSDPYQGALVEGYALCKGAANPEGAALFAECAVVAANDEGAQAIADRKRMDDAQWSEELVAIEREINELARQYPVIELASGCSNDIAAYTTEGGDTVGTRAALHGTDWASNREAIADTITMLVDEVNTELQAKIAELG